MITDITLSYSFLSVKHFGQLLLRFFAGFTYPEKGSGMAFNDTTEVSLSHDIDFIGRADGKITDLMAATAHKMVMRCSTTVVMVRSVIKMKFLDFTELYQQI